MQLHQIHRLFLEKLQPKFSVDEARFYLKSILQSLFEIPPTDLALDPTRLIPEEQYQKLDRVAAQLLADVPLQQILGYCDFLDFTVKLSPDVLIPRPETEELVEWLLDSYQTFPTNVLDIGTGSGCIAIALAKKWGQEAHITALDKSPKALAIAQKNAHLNGVQIDFVEQDMTQVWTFGNTWDLIVSNPPYVLLSEKEQMHARVLEHEPHMALFSPSQSTIYFYEAIHNQALKFLSPQGWLYFEINPLCVSQLQALFSDQQWMHFEVRNDTFGKARFLRVQKQ